MSRVRTNAIGPVTGTTLAITGSTLWDPLHPTIDAWGDGTHDDRAVLNTLANSTIPATGGTILFRNATYRIASSMTFPSNVTLNFALGAMLAIDTGVTVTINGQIEAGLHQIFDCTGTGAVSFPSPGGVPETFVAWWGANGDENTEQYDALQAAFDQTPALKPCRLTPGTYPVRKPLRVRKTDAWVKGDGKRVVTIRPANNFEGGPLVVCAPAVPDWPAPRTTTSLATGDGFAFVLADDEAQMISLGDCREGRLDGYDEICIECFFRVDASNNIGTLISSAGQRLPNEAVTTAFKLAVTTGGVLQGVLTTGGTEHTLTSGAGAVADDTIYHAALTYDGSTVRLFLGEPGSTNALADSEAATGTVTQPFAEDMLIGTSAGEWPQRVKLAFQATAPDGAIDGVRISDAARYTATMTTPTAKPSSDANTSILLNFDSIDDIFVVGTTGGTPTYFPMWNKGFPNWISRPRIEGLGFGGGERCSGLLVFASIDHKIHDIHVNGGVPFGMIRWRETFISEMSGLSFQPHTSTVVQLVNAFNSGVTTASDIQVEGAPYGIVDCGHSGLEYSHVYISPGSNAIIGHILNGVDEAILTGYNLNFETTADDYEYSVAITNLIRTCVCSGFTAGGGEVPALYVDQANRLTIVGGYLFNDFSAVAIEVDRAGTHPITLVNSFRSLDSVPWADDLSEIVLVQDGKMIQGPKTLTDNDTTPSILGAGNWLASNSSSTSITDFDDAVDGDRIEIEFTNANTTIVDGATIQLAGGANFVGSADDILTLRYRDGVWREVSRSVN